ncbi:WecB/TagA/CpsF family glycosyltransferase, partial [Microcystis aeruginosa]|uniref:WecB/TagA/CpsF family glycosyltransferase n=1 Tax=Microcystis aeruginosa TaxID=1126 RepID=UPI001C209E50
MGAHAAQRRIMHQYTPNFDRNVHCLLGLPFDALNLHQATALVQDAAKNRTPCFLSTPNLNFLVTSRRDAAFRQSVLHSNLSLADGMPIVWLARLMGTPMPQRVAGSDLFEALRANANDPIKVYFFGGLPGVAQEAHRVLNAAGGSMKSVGYADPGFVPVQDMGSDATLRAINQSAPDFLVVALGAGKGQAWIEKYKTLLNVPVISHLGAVVNFVAGTVQRAPRWMQKSGLEWLWRIWEEPSLWKRYWNDGLGLLRFLTFNVPAARICLLQMGLGKPSA